MTDTPKRPPVGLLPTERIAYSPIAGRAVPKLPGGARMVVWCIVNVEEWDINSPMPRTVLTPPAGGAPSPDIPNWAWHEYGNRVGFWRMLKVFDEFKVPATLAINGSAIAAYPQIVEAANERHWEFIGHGFTQRNMQKVEDERADIRRTREVISLASGKPPRGWLGPGLTETWETPDLLVEEGYDYVCDWVLDDQPVWLKTRPGRILNVPYTQECNDVAMMLIQHHPASRIFRARARPVRADLRGRRRRRARDGAGAASLHSRCAAPAEIFPRHHRDDRGEAGCAALDRQPDRGLVHQRDLILRSDPKSAFTRVCDALWDRVSKDGRN